MVSQQQIEAFRREGYLVLPGVFDSAQMKEITGWVEELHSWPETPGKHMMYFEESSRADKRRILNRIENFYPYHEMMADLLDDEMRAGCGELFGEPAVLFKEKVNFKMPGGGGFEAHQDVQAGWDDYVGLAVTAMVTIDETTTENGCLEIGRWRHRQEMIGELWRPLQPAELVEVDFTPLPSKPGDLVFFDSYVPHQSAPNLTDAPRRVLYVTYNRASDGDHCERYYADKRKSYPPDCERDADKVYEYKV